jgi:hypothetical protein
MLVKVTGSSGAQSRAKKDFDASLPLLAANGKEEKHSLSFEFTLTPFRQMRSLTTAS